MVHTVLPTLRTRRLILRPFTLADAPAVQRLAGAPEIYSTTRTIPHPYEDGMAEAWISSRADAFAAGQAASFAVTLEDNTLVGATGLNLEPADHRAELGYWIGVPYWGHGYATESAEAVMAFGFESLQLHRIHACFLRRNPASGRVMEKLGMQYEGTRRQHEVKLGVHEDLVHYGILRTDPRGPTA
ncbi:MAG: GNAT family N-acetyltransferase [Gemmatimonadaceae bacterium]|nr:GNAT family N-acetyltransferase [Gemmatimonadaceae bacterium]